MNLQPVDQCDVTVLVDNVTDLLSSVPGNVTPHVHNLVKTGKVREISGTCACCAHWGLSLVIQVTHGDTSHMLLCDTVQDIRQFELREIVPGHCTGWRAVHELIDVFGAERVIPSAVGQSHHF